MPGGPQSWSEHKSWKKNPLLLPESIFFFQPVAKHYTD
jgi:hypothetical protein